MIVGGLSACRVAICTSKEAQRFFADNHGESSVSVVQRATEMLQKFEEHSEFYKTAGKWRPMLYWVGKGFDSQLLEANTPAAIAFYG